MKRIFVIILAIAMLLPAFPVVATVNEIVVHVSPLGSDSNNGTDKKPLATLEGARVFVKKMEKTMPIRVIFHEGEYRFKKGVNFDEADSGNKGAPVIYEAAVGEKVTFKGSLELDATKFNLVTDSAILDRLPKDSRAKVGQLDLKAQGITKIDALVLSTSQEAIGGEYVSFFLNGKEQPISQWPNGEDNYASWEKIISKGSVTNIPSTGSGGIIEYKESNPSRWTKANDFYLGGYPGYDYRYERIPCSKVDPKAKTLALTYGSNFGFINGESKRWKAFNLLEEIDIPGEWYIDRDSMILYYYPSYTLSNANFEMAFLKDDFIKMVGTHDITIKGINFTQTCANAIELLSSVDSINIENCSFAYIGQKAVYISGSTKGELRDSTINITDGGTNCIIRDNNMQYIGSNAIVVFGGNMDTLKRGENHIENNHIYNAARSAINSPNIETVGVGNYIEHNLIHNAPFHAINFSGNDHAIRYNELYDVGREAYDAAVMYTGRSLIRRGTEVAYNFVHDYLRKDEKIDYDVVGMFLDDRVSGINIHHNIFMNGAAGVQVGGGHNNIVESNTLLNMKGNILNSDNRGETWNLDWGEEAALKKALEIPIYGEKYPELFQTVKDPKPPHGNVITNNLSDKPAPVVERIVQLGTVKNNISVSDLTDFVDPQALDYRVKSDSETAKKIPSILTDKFDLNKFGLQTNENRKTILKPDEENSPFRKLYPQNGETNINALNCTFTWESALYADKYRILIATDPDMKNIVLDKETDYNYITVSTLEKGLKPYYWKIQAINTSRQIPSTWENSGVPFVFTTTLYDILDKAELGTAINISESAFSKITEGTNVGQYKAGVKDPLQDAIIYAKDVYALRQGQATQAQLNSTVENLKKKLAEASAGINKGYAGIDNMLKTADDWISPAGAVKVDANEFKFTSTEDSQALYKVNPSQSEILCFKAKIDFGDNPSWTAFTLRQLDSTKILWATQDYLVVVKPNAFELQRFPGGMLASTNNSVMKSGEWHDIQFGAIDVASGVNLIFKVDGKTVFDFIDSAAPLKDNGAFGIFAAKNHSISLKNVETIPNGDQEYVYLNAEELNVGELLRENESWKASGGNSLWSDNGLSFTATTDKDVLSYTKPLAVNKILNLDAMFNAGDKWQALGMRTQDVDKAPWLTNDYLVVIKQNSLELQRFKDGKNELLGISDNTYIKDGQKVNIRYGAYEVEGGVRIVFYVDGKKVFDYLDSNAIASLGNFTVYDMSQKGVNIYPAQEMAISYAEPITIKRDGDIYSNTSTSYGSTGEWSKTTIGFDKMDLKASNGAGATAKWTLTIAPGIYKVYYWKGLDVDGDKKANLEIFASGDDGIRNLPIDFSRGNAGWKDMGVHYPSDGLMILTLSGSGSGNLVSSAIRLVKATPDDMNFSHLFEKANGAMVLKIDSQKAFVDRTEIKIPNAAPTIVNGTTLVPLRFVAETFGGLVTWDDATSTATVKIGNNIMNFTNDQAGYTINGEAKSLEQGAVIVNEHMMLPLRVISESIGKQVFWDDSGLIVIAEKIEINAKNDTSIIKGALAALKD